MKRAELYDAEECEDRDHVTTPVINRNTANTSSTHLQNASDSSADGSSNSSEQECEYTLQASDADNAKICFKRKIKRWCGYAVDRRAIYQKNGVTGWITGPNG